jgi:ATP synthase protein I
VERRQAALRLVGLGWFVGLCIGLGVWGGRQLDGKFGTGPLLVIAGLILGVIVAFYGVYRMILPNINKKQTGGGK